MMESGNGQGLKRAFRHLAEDAMSSHWAEGIDQDGFARWIKNEDAARLFEDVYAIKEAFKKLVTSKMAMKNHHLGAATLRNKHFKKIVEMFYEDMGVENHDQLMAKLQKMGMKIAMKMHKCKKMQKLFKALERLIVMAERTKEIFDMPAKEDVEAWWNEHDFQPWM
jgi:hypothetical protein